MKLQAQTPDSVAREFFDRLSIDSLDLVDQFYAPEVVFKDPLTTHRSSAEIKQYYRSMYQNVVSIRFEYSKSIVSENDLALFWIMHIKLNKLNGGKPYAVSGMSRIEFNQQLQAVYHEDIFDVGAFIYERIPLLGSLIRYIKNKLASQNHE